MTTDILRHASRAALGIMFALLGWRLWLFFKLGWRALHWPFELDYGEGIVWQQANMMLTPDAYGRIDGFPAIVFHYTPVFHLMTRALNGVTGYDMLYSGRLISLGSTLLSALMIGLIIARAAPSNLKRSTRILAGAGGALSIFCVYPVMMWAPNMRVDMLSFLLSTIGFWLGLKAFERPSLVYAAALCFVAAVYTKQTAIAAPVALFGLMLWLRPKLAVRGILTCIVSGLVILGALQWMTDGGFFRHIFLYNINRVEWKRIDLIPFMIKFHWPFFVAGIVMLLPRLRDVQRRAAVNPLRSSSPDMADIAWIGIMIYLIVILPTLLGIAKSGSSLNYLIELFFVVAILAGCGLHEVARLALSRGKHTHSIYTAVAALAVPLVLAGQAWTFTPPYLGMIWNPAQEAGLRALTERVKGERKPVIGDSMVVLLRAGKPVLWEPAIFAELASNGIWDESQFVARIRRREFAMFITNKKRGAPVFNARYTPAMADAMDEAYPILEKMGGYTLHLPLDVENPKSKVQR